MTGPLRLLFVEDSATDAKLIELELRRALGPLHVARVEDRSGMREALAREPWDVVVSDWAMPTFSAPLALALIKELGIDLPLIIVSGTIGEENAIEALRAGARDYIQKDKLARLAPAVKREFGEKVAREARRAAEVALRESEARNRRLIDSNIIGIITWSDAGEILQTNDAFLDVVGYTREDVASGRVRLSELNLPEYDGLERQARIELATTGRCAPYEREYARKDGTRAPVVVGGALLDGRSDLGISFILDVSDRKRAEAALQRTEEQLRHAQKMEAVGSLAGGLAHDFNNLLSVILSYAHLLGDGLHPDHPMRADLDEITAAGERAAALTRQLLAFSRQQMLSPKILDVNEVVLEMDRMLGRLIGAHIELTTAVTPGPALVKVDPSQLDQVLMNLMVNARDAMPDGGRLTVSTSIVEHDAEYLAEHVGARPGPHLELTVSDTGVGMDAATRARIFEPFFTTKEKGKGTGLGLSTVFGIVEQSGGRISVETEPGSGTTFRIHFPLADAAEAGRTTTATGAPPRGAPGAETILLVEDDDQVRGLARTVLRRRGYTVLDAASGADALEVLEHADAPIDLLLTDVVMPRLSGPELALRVRALRPAIRVLFMSGYVDRSITPPEAGAAFLAKPFTPEVLVNRVREVLDAVDEREP